MAELNTGERHESERQSALYTTESIVEVTLGCLNFIEVLLCCGLHVKQQSYYQKSIGSVHRRNCQKSSIRDHLFLYLSAFHGVCWLTSFSLHVSTSVFFHNAKNDPGNKTVRTKL